jgi:hypothetical protein
MGFGIAMTAASLFLAGCGSRARTQRPPIDITISHCRTDMLFYHVHAYTTTGGDVVRFINKDGRVLTVDFGDRWPFEGLPHSVSLDATLPSHLYPIAQFVNHKAYPDTFYFRVKGSSECGVPPGGPGLIMDE